MVLKSIVLKSLAVCLFLGLFQGALGQQRTFNIVDFGAIPDNKTVNSKAIQKCIDVCFQSGGGSVYVPNGIFLTGTIELKSNTTLLLENGAVLKGSPNIEDYKAYFAPNFPKSHYGIIYALKASNVSIKGFGRIDGNDSVFFDWTKAKKIDAKGTQFTRQKEEFRKVTSGVGDGPVVPYDEKRPRQMIIFSECKNVNISEVLIANSPFWTLHFADCDGVFVNGIKIWNSLLTPNSDGIDVTSCSNVVITNSDIRAGDDAIAIVGYAYHFELPGYSNLRHSSENINVSNCNLQSKSSGIRIGFLDQNSVRNINISNINITNSNRGIGIFVRDEGSIENIHFSNINIETRLHTGDWWGNGEPIHISVVKGTESGKLGRLKNVNFRDITAVSDNGILIYNANKANVSDISFDSLNLTIIKSDLNEVAGGNIDLRGCYNPSEQLFKADLPAIFINNIQNLSLNRIKLDWQVSNIDFFTHGLQIENCKNVKLNDFDGIGIKNKQSTFPVIVKNTKLVSTNVDAKDLKILP